MSDKIDRILDLIPHCHEAGVSNRIETLVLDLQADSSMLKSVYDAIIRWRDLEQKVSDVGARANALIEMKIAVDAARIYFTKVNK